MDIAAEKNSDRDDIPKRHSIAVVSEVADPNGDKKNANKKVEFCRTEVHFDTTPGKINIVDMEDKPAPAQLYRPKKRQVHVILCQRCVTILRILFNVS